MKEQLKDPSRRRFGKVAATLGAASMTPFVATESKAQAEQRGAEIRKRSIVKNVDSPIVIDPMTFKLHKQTNIAFYNRNTMVRKNKKGEYDHWANVANEKLEELILSSKYSPKIKAPSVAAARSVAALDIGMTSVSRLFGEWENRKLLKWTPQTLEMWPKLFSERSPDEKDKNTLTKQVKVAARLAGADIVGVAALNRNWVYSNAMIPKEGIEEPHGPQDMVEKQIVFGDVEQPQETETQLIIPDSVNNVVISAIAMNREMVQTAPTLMTEAAVFSGYSRMSMHDTALCEYIRAMGYIAIPCVNSVAQSVPIAIEAGLGEGSRMGLLITPEYGPNVRLTKVLTNMPLNHDKPIEFGVEKFCETCMKCARECPSKAVTEGVKSFETRNELNQPGKFQWQNDYKKCHDYWVESASSCGICVASCPFTKGDIWIHDGVEWAIKNASFLDPIMLGMDDAMGYGERRDVQEVWDGPINTYGLDTDHFQDTKKSYGGKS